jgi:hypothetical protein
MVKLDTVSYVLKMNVPFITNSAHLRRRATLYRVWQTNLHCPTYESKEFCYAISGSRTVIVAKPYSTSFLCIRLVYSHTQKIGSVFVFLLSLHNVEVPGLL